MKQEALVMELYEELVNKILSYNSGVDLMRVRAAFDCAEEAHKGQVRRDGSPYVTHAIVTAQIAAEMGLDEDSIVSALLHDCIEDTTVSYADISKKFGVAVADIVEGVTKLTRVQYTSKEDEQMENLRKMLIAMSKDIRVILIKIADRLHNMRTMDYQTELKQKSKSLETMEIYAPIAHRLGMQKIKWELEDLSLFYLDPVGYAEITEVLDTQHGLLKDFLKQVGEKIKARLEDDVTATVYGRIKHIYSIYRKMYTQKRDLYEIFDLCAFRVIVESIPDCYNVLGHIHDMFKPLPGRFKDYISTPKPNMYQSIHTTVIGTEGIPFEVQIRTWEMHRTAEYGIAAHWKYKSGDSGVRAGDEERFAWVRRLLETQQESEATDFFHDLKIDMFADEVFVFTPQGDVINLPAGATPIDFAYAIHSAIGNKMTGAKVSGRIVPFDQVLQNGDVVEVITSKSAIGPSRDWINLAKSGQARTKIKQWFKKEKREENIIHGKEMFDAELRRNKIDMSSITNEDFLPVVLKKIAVTSLDDMYSAIGYGGMTAVKAVNRIKDELIRAAKPTAKNALEKLTEQVKKNARQEKEGVSVNGVLVEGMDNCLVKFSRCCTPVPGDDIIGFITRGYGVSIHRTDCQNYLSNRNNDEGKGRWINVSWSGTISSGYLTTLKLLSTDRDGLIMDIATVLNTLNARVRSLSARDIGSGKASVTVTMEVRTLDELKQTMARLGSIAGVSEVVRSGE